MSFTVGAGTVGGGTVAGGAGAASSSPALFLIEVQDVDYTAFYGDGTLRVDRSLQQRSTASFILWDKEKTLDIQVGYRVKITVQGTVLFHGTIQEFTKNDFPAEPVNRFNVRCVDFNQLADRFVVAAVYETPGQTLKDIVDDIVQNQADGRLALEGVTTDLVVTGPEIEVAKFNYVTATRAFNLLGEETGLQWNLNDKKQLEFFDRTTYIAPFGFGVLGGAPNHRRLTVKRTRAQYRNKQFVRGGNQVTDDRTERFVGDGETQTFPLSFELANDPSDNPPIVTVNEVAQTVGVLGVDQDGDFDWFVQQGRDTLAQSTEAAALTDSDTLSITYQGLFPTIVDAEDNAEIAARAAVEGGTGVYTEVETDSDISTRDLAIEKANNFLRRYGEIPLTVEVDTQQFGLRPGHLVQIVNPSIGIDDEFLVSQIDFSHRGKLVFDQIVTCISGELLGGWVEFFRKLQRQGVPVSIGANETLVLSRTARDEIIITDEAVVSLDPLDLIEFFEDACSVAQLGFDPNDEPSFVFGFGKFGQHPLLTL